MVDTNTDRRVGESVPDTTRRTLLRTTGAGILAAGGLSAVGGSASAQAMDSFVEVDGTDFVVDGEPFYPVGGNHPQLRKQSAEDQEAMLDQWQEAVPAFNVVRATAFGSGTENDDFPLQPEPGEYSEDAFQALDRLVAAAGERGIRLVLPLTNYWDWQGGIPQYVSWVDGAESKGDFYTNEECRQLYFDFIEYVLTRENTVTGVEYRNDPTIMMWEHANEPDGSGGDFYQWVEDVAAHITSIDDNHLVSTGMGMDTGTSHFREAHSRDGIDAYSLHIWADSAEGHTGIGPDGGIEVLREHKGAADDLGMPLYAGEYGWPVDRSGSDDMPDHEELNERIRVFSAWFREMRELGVDGSLIWDTRHDDEFPLTWDLYGVFPNEDPHVPDMMADAYGAWSTAPSAGPAASVDPPSMSTDVVSAPGQRQVVVPNTGGGVSEDPLFSLSPSGAEVSNPDGEDNTSGPEDVSADVYLGYDDGALYLRAEVTDDTHNGTAGSSMWQEDSIQIAAGYGGAYGPEYGFSLADGSTSVNRWIEGSAAAGADAVTADVSRSGATTTYDVEFPWETLFPADRGPGDTMPFSIIVNDDDNDAAEGADDRDAVLGWTLPAIANSKSVGDLGLAILETEQGAPWQLSGGDGPSMIDAGTQGTWTYTVANYGSGEQTFDVSVTGTDLSESITVPAGQAAEIELSRGWENAGAPSQELVVTSATSGERSSLSSTVVVLDPDLPTAQPQEDDGEDGDGELSGRYLMRDRFDSTDHFTTTAGEVWVTEYQPVAHELLDGSTDQYRIERASGDTASIVYETDEPVSGADLLWSQDQFSGGQVAFYESTDGGESWQSVAQTTEMLRVLDSPDAEDHWGQMRTRATGFSGSATQVRIDITGDDNWSPTLKDLLLLTPAVSEAVHTFEDTSSLSDQSDLDLLAPSDWETQYHLFPDGSEVPWRLERSDASTASAVFESDEPVDELEVLWVMQRWDEGSLEFYESSDGGDSWSQFQPGFTEYNRTAEEDQEWTWSQRRTTYSDFAPGTDAVRVDFVGGAGWTPCLYQVALRSSADGPTTPMVGGRGAPQDLDGDSRLDDVDGDGDSDLHDIETLADNARTEAVEDNPQWFDYDGDGDYDRDDLVRLFQELQ